MPFFQVNYQNLKRTRKADVLLAFTEGVGTVLSTTVNYDEVIPKVQTYMYFTKYSRTDIVFNEHESGDSIDDVLDHYKGLQETE